MHPEEDHLNNLAARARQGDARAAQELRDRLERHLPLIARRAVRLARRSTLLARIIHDEAERLAATPFASHPVAPERVISLIAGRLCDIVLGAVDHAHEKCFEARETVKA